MMNKRQTGGWLFFLFLIGFIVLASSSGYLYRQNKQYRDENRRLIIQNDSILSVNIELKNALERKNTSAINLSGKQIKRGEQK